MAVCDPFYDLPVVSNLVDSQLGTLIHEHTHLAVGGVDGTGDSAYDYGLHEPWLSTRHVTKFTPHRGPAVLNADNYAFFSTNALATTLVTAAAL